jgi:DNA-binding transcriptional ArsR family regulator
VPASPDPSATGARSATGAPGARGRAGEREPPDALFAALADGTRRRILRTVAEHGPVTATALAGHVPVTRQAVAKHLALLRDAGLVTAERAGRETRFTAATAPLDDLAAWAEAAGRRWDDRLDRLRRRLE